MGRLRHALLLLVSLLALVPAGADEVDQDRARRLVMQGAIMPLEQLLVAVREQTAEGKLLEVELEEKRGQLVYEVEVLEPSGQVIELLFDARTAELLRRKIE